MSWSRRTAAAALLCALPVMGCGNWDLPIRRDPPPEQLLRKPKEPQLAPVERVQMADRGIRWLKKSIELNAYPPEPYTYVNLLYRERSAAHKCQLTDGGAAVQDGGVAVNDAGVGGCPQITADLKEAQKYFEVAMAKYRERSGAKPDAGAKDAPKDSKAGKTAPPAGKGGAK